MVYQIPPASTRHDRIHCAYIETILLMLTAFSVGNPTADPARYPLHRKGNLDGSFPAALFSLWTAQRNVRASARQSQPPPHSHSGDHP